MKLLQIQFFYGTSQYSLYTGLLKRRSGTTSEVSFLTQSLFLLSVNVYMIHYSKIKKKILYNKIYDY